MKDNMLIFNDNEIHTEIRYVIAIYSKSKWYHYLDFPNIKDAKEHLEKVRKIHPDIEFRVFEKIEQATVNMLDKAIEIVKQDVVSDDVCEWKKYLKYHCVWLVGCKIDLIASMQGKYCPYCGKKIKIVGD